MQTYATALDAFLKREGNSENDLSEKIGRPQPSINRYRNNKRFPDADTARLIDAATDGEVSFLVWQADFLSRSGIAA